MDSEISQKETISISWIGKFFCDYDEIQLTNDGLSIRKNNAVVTQIDLKDITYFAKEKTGIFLATIEIQYLSNKMCFKWLRKNNIENFTTELNKRIKDILSSRIKNKIIEFYDLTLSQYPRDSWEQKIRELYSEIEAFSKELPLYRKYFEENLCTAIEDIANIGQIDIQSLQSRHESFQLERRKNFFDTIESYPLTEEQRLGVIRNNDKNMVLAAAGTGKTSVIIAKVLDIIDRALCSPEEILVLAYNRATANEIEERIQEKARKSNITYSDKPFVATFHALGRFIIRESGIRPIMSIFSDDKRQLEIWAATWLETYMRQSIKNFFHVLQCFPEPFDPMTVESKAEYERYLRDNEIRTLKNEKVKGYQELLIANFLFLNGIEYGYEEPYLKKLRLEDNIDYRPDFHLLGTNIYIEHFGIDRDGNTRKDIDREEYNRNIIRKRELHKKYGTVLIETYHYEWKENILYKSLTTKLQEHNIELKPRTKEEIDDILKDNDNIVSDYVKILIKALQAIRVENLDKESIQKRLENFGIFFPELKTKLLVSFLNAYKEELRKENAIDFDDMIILSKICLDEKKYYPQWKYIFVDEYQDISMSRMNLITSLIENSNSSSFTAVGDDWQAIYRFSGGKLELTTRFEELVGKCSLTKLQKTFRYNDSIADVSEKFIMENPEQIKKHIVTHEKVNSPQVFLLDDLVNDKQNINSRILETIHNIRKNDQDGSIFVIARYNNILYGFNEYCRMCRIPINNVQTLTFHKSKGLECDYAVLVGLTQGRYGFPCENRDDAIVEALLPLIDEFPHSEERRLMYVGLTRAKKQCYIIADPYARSAFVKELLSAWYRISILSKYFTQNFKNLFKCPYCTEGYLRLRDAKYGKIYFCSSQNGCPVGKAHVCEKCGFPMGDYVTERRCLNPACGNTYPICEKCGRPMRVRTGKYGQFLGCSGYGIKDDQCTNTRNLPSSFAHN